jgi:hypothetical protein
MLFSLINFAVLLYCVRGDITLLDFSESPTTSCKHWTLTNDPVMGGVSYSTWETYPSNSTTEVGYGLWDGSVEIVPSLNAPGTIDKVAYYCIVYSFNMYIQ